MTWAFSMTKFTMYIMNRSHFQILPSGIHSWYSSSLISAIMVPSSLKKGFLVLYRHLLGGFSLVSCLYSFSLSQNCLYCGHSASHDEVTNGKFSCLCIWSLHLHFWEIQFSTCLVDAFAYISCLQICLCHYHLLIVAG